ncbi:hypothetical protein NE865_00936 [Phthorimaea operculella]|nr:hypothetical protein NE865_00936 [Phthorimaea operculella]
MILFDGHAYTQRSKKTYVCSLKPNVNCNAKLSVDKDGKIIDSFTKHYHPPKKYVKCSDGICRILYGSQWVCSIKVPGCKGKLKLEDGRITAINNNHNHLPRKYMKTAEGKLVRI